MADEALVRALADCLEALRDGESALAACLVKYPDRRSDLEELLRVVDLIPRLPAGLIADPAFVERTREWLAGWPPGPATPGLPGSDAALA